MNEFVLNDISFSLDDLQTGLNNNILITGCSGVGKTRKIIAPNLVNFKGVQIAFDPKGELLSLVKNKLQCPYDVFDLNNPECSTVTYNPLSYVKLGKNLYDFVHTLIRSAGENFKDLYWDMAATQLLEYTLLYLKERQTYTNDIPDFNTLYSLCDTFCKCYESPDPATPYRMMEEHNKKFQNSTAFHRFMSTTATSSVTASSIVSSTQAKLIPFLTTTQRADTINLDKLCDRENYILFIHTGDMDDSVKPVLYVLYYQLIKLLSDRAKNTGGRLKVPVRIIFDDFGNLPVLPVFPKVMASSRSRNISQIISVQSESQLYSMYETQAVSVRENCDTMICLSSNDFATAKEQSARAGISVDNILTMPVGQYILFRRGEQIKFGKL